MAVKGVAERDRYNRPPKTGYKWGENAAHITDAVGTNGYKSSEIGAHITGLSQLQRWILIKANESHGQHRNGVDLLYSEIKHQFYGVPLKNPEYWTMISTGTGEKKNVRQRETGGRVMGSQIFASTDNKNYAAISASISRAVRRLERRGLVTVYRGTMSCWAGVSLTDSGIELASTLADGGE